MIWPARCIKSPPTIMDVINLQTEQNMLPLKTLFSAVTTRPIDSMEVEADSSLVISQDEFMTAVDRDEFLEVGANSE